jgi:peptide/nickel transport system permease protein
MRGRRFSAAWLAVLGIVLASAALAPLAGPRPGSQPSQAAQFLGPGAGHPLGTDSRGEDVLLRTLWAARNSFASAVLATGVALGLAVAFGSLSGMAGGAVDWTLMRGVDVFLAFPGLLLALALVAILDTGAWQAAVAVGIALAPTYTRLVRAAVLAVRSRTYVQAARTLGGSTGWIIRRHVLPNVAGEIGVFATVIYAWSLLNLSALEFLGVSGSPSTPTLGRMLSEGRAYLRVAPWIALVPGIVLTLSILAVTGLSDAWRRHLPGGREGG